MKQVIKITGDGSATLFVPELKEHYHSTFGAVQESMHVFIKSGLHHLNIENPKILEVGFGTGLNALLTILNSESYVTLEYHGIEIYPVSWEMVSLLEYQSFLKLTPEQFAIFQNMHTSSWNNPYQFNSKFIFKKFNLSIQELKTEMKYDLVYFDAFAPEVQPELWDEDIFLKLYSLLNAKGILVTYCAKGEVRRIMQRCGFTVERLPGPPGKREMLRAIK